MPIIKLDGDIKAVLMINRSTGEEQLLCEKCFDFDDLDGNCEIYKQEDFEKDDSCAYICDKCGTRIY